MDLFGSRANSSHGGSKLPGFSRTNQLTLLIDSASDYAICMLDTKGHVMVWNKGAERLYQWTESEALGKHHSIFFEPADLIACKPAQHIAEALERGRKTERGWRVRKDGTRFLSKSTLTSVRNPAGEVIAFGKVVHDISAEQEHVEGIAARENFIRSILATVPDAMVVINEHGIVESFSAAGERLFGYRADEVLGRNVSMLMPEADAAHHDGYLWRYAATGNSHFIGGSGRRVLGRRKDGSTFSHELHIAETRIAGRRIFTGFIRDMTLREQAEARMKELQVELLEATRASAMSTLAEALAHELKQPLTVVSNYVQASRALLEVGKSPDIATACEALAKAEAEALRAGEVIDHLRAFVVRGEARKQFVQLPKLIEDGCEMALAVTRARGVVASFAFSADLDSVMVDPVLVQQVVINLVRNAADAMAADGHGEVHLSAHRVLQCIEITVADTGPGLPDGVGERLFEPFNTTKQDGMGLGLSICRRVIEAHGGSIWARPGPKGGTIFHFTLPCGSAQYVAEHADVGVLICTEK